MSVPQVYLVEDDRSVRESLGVLLAQANIRFSTFSTSNAFLTSYDLRWAGCLVLDMHLPDMTALELLDRLRQLGCELPFIVISGRGTVSEAMEAMRRGAVDFLEKPLDVAMFIDRVTAALRRDEIRRIEREEYEQFSSHLAQLTRREAEILDLVVAGKLTKQIAALLGIAAKTVEAHRSNITKKLKMESIPQLVRRVTLHRLHPASDEPESRTS